MRLFSVADVRPLGYARLAPPRGLPNALRRTLRALRAANRDALSPAACCLEDNAPFLLDEWDSLRRTLRAAPALPAVNGRPRILLVAEKIRDEAQDDLSMPAIVRIARAAQGDFPFTQRELSLLRPALQRALMDNVFSLAAQCRAEARRLRDAESWLRRAARGETPAPPRSAAVAEALAERLAADGGAALDIPPENGIPAEALLRDAGEKKAANGMMAGQLISSLRRLNQMSFERILRRLDPVEAILRADATFRRMDAAGRERYRRAAARIAHRLRTDECAVARAACALADGKSGLEREAGYYLLEKSDEIAKALFRRGGGFLARHQTGAFLACLYGGTALLAAAAMLVAPWPLLLPVALCASELVRLLVYRAARRLFPARALPRIQIRRLSRERRTLVVVPTLLTSPKQALRMTRQLALLHAAQPDPYLDFMLLGDFADSPTQSLPADEEILDAARAGVAALNRAHDGGFYYLQRARTWDAGQNAFTGKERKRGALEALNRLLCGRETPAFLYASCDVNTLRRRYAYVITLDADTFMPPGAAYKLVGAMEHPLQKGRVAVIQPRMAVAGDRVKTNVQRLLGGRGGTDPYGMAVQDVYQDVFGRGSFVGKGIYAPEAWLSALENRLPAGRLLSHDLIEGECAGSMLAEDIVLYDGHPMRLSGWQKRLHRWTRGDWQLLPFLFDRRLSLLSRHKIWDNLRRSLVPAAQVALLLAGAFGHPALLLLALPWPLRGLGVRLTLLPGKALTQLDAALRALYRQFVSKKKLLSWVTAAQAENGDAPALSCVLVQLAAGAGMLVCSLLPQGFEPAVFIGMLWTASPLLLRYADAPTQREPGMTDAQKTAVRALARDTWRFFEDCVTEKTRFLPPDNVQLEPDKGAAMRTSPTNIGLYLLSCCAARELGLITTRDMAVRLSRTLGALSSLRRWRGHCYNWYDLETLDPLPPRFVSTVDSGNLRACLIACAQLCRQRLAEMPQEYLPLPAQMDALAAQMDFSPLYDRGAGLFYVGLGAENEKPTGAHYDLMASEARMASFLAVASGQAPRRHWARLGRRTVRAGGGPSLLSWGGTLFEYLMPALLMPLSPGTLLRESCLNACRAQMLAAGGRPFGVSESGYYAFDPELNYRYRAFGLPLLALSAETGGDVVAPYASMLALPFYPRACAENYLRMRRLGWTDAHGLYEAADYGAGERNRAPRLVKSHMAHHQGMILCAVCNALTDFSLERAFMAPPWIQAYAYLLCESAPTRAGRRRTLPPPRRETQESGRQWKIAAQDMPPDTQLLFGNGTTWALTAHGMGYLKHSGMMITRFWETLQIPAGPQFFIRREDTGDVWRMGERDKAIMTEGGMRFERENDDCALQWRCAVDPLSGWAVAALRVENKRPDTLTLSAISYLEIAQGALSDDLSHPNFRDLSVRVEEWDGAQGLLSRRLPRSARDETPLILHAVIGDVAALRRQGDRRLFLGDGDAAHPAQAALPADACAYRIGDVIAPCLSLRAEMRLPAKGRAQLYFITAVRDRPPEPPLLSQAKSALALAATQAQMTLRFLGMDESTLSLCQQLAGALLYHHQAHQLCLPSAPPDALWRLGVSGELPVLLLLMTNDCDKASLRLLLRCHAWMRLQGVWVDFVILCPGETGYFNAARDMAAAMIAASPARDWQGIPGGVHLSVASPEEAEGARLLARVTLRGGAPIKGQLAALRRIALPLQTDNTLPLPITPPALSIENGYGGFTDEGDYIITRRPPAPWHLLLCNELFGTLLSDRGVLQSYYVNSRLGRLTRPAPDVHAAFRSEEMLLRTESGACASTMGGTIRFSPGEAACDGYLDGVYFTLSVFTHPVLPLGVRLLTLRTEGQKRLRLLWRVRFDMGERPESTRYETDGAMGFARCGDMPGVAFGCLHGASSATDFDHALVSWQMDEPLAPHAAKTLACLIGFAPDKASAREMARRAEEEGSAALRETRRQWAARLDGLRLFTADQSWQWMLRWLPYQAWTARLLARMGPYQAGGAYGFRDQLQDVLCLMHTAPDVARAHILLCAAHQYEEGDVQHWWHAPRRGVRTRISDDKLFLPFLTAVYVQITGDESILQARAPYLSSPPLAPDEGDRYEEPDETDRAEPLLCHCLRAIDSVALGRHGLPLMGGGDWNDGMNRLGGKNGESVWLGFFLCWTLRLFAPLCAAPEKERLDALRRALLDAAEAAWADGWYLRAWADDGRPVGGPATDPPRIDLISQCFSVFAGAPRQRAREAVLAAYSRLYDREAGVVKLLDPPFTPEEGAGYIGAYLPGIRENGGQYTHAVPWLVLALCDLGENARAWEIAEAILPPRHSDVKARADVYQLEPYVLCGDVSAGQNMGRGGWSWYTGSAAWLYFVTVTRLLGFEKRGDRARLAPCPHPNGEEYTLVYRFGGASYHFTAAADALFPTLDGEKLPQDSFVSLIDDGRTHEARYPLRAN
ncbi:MAG: hypothetical protein MR400_07130 [Clostridiales bacterium]|nr:hypothetical protein [Clostridiales bacterium]